MMDYIPGQIHESFQKEMFLLVNNDFNWINCKDKRLNEMNDISDWDETATIKLKSLNLRIYYVLKGMPF